MQEGDEAPNFELTANDGTTINLNSYRGKIRETAQRIGQNYNRSIVHKIVG